MRRIRFAAVAPLWWLCLAAVDARAQPFESVFGEAARFEQAGRRAAPVTHCAGGGSIATGISKDSAGSEIYLVRADDSGGTLWEKAYALSLAGTNTTQGASGQSVVELANGSGFVIAGTTTSATTDEDVFLLKVGCNGTVRWLKTYHDPGLDSAADVIEAANGDLVAAGYSANKAGKLDGLLLRTNSKGVKLWSRRYHLANALQRFRALTETRAHGQRLPDIVAVGESTTDGALKGFAVRVAGANGGFGGALNCAATYDVAPKFLTLRSVVELQSGSHAGDLVMVGRTAASLMGTTGRDIFALRTRPNPCTVERHRRIWDPANKDSGEEDAYDVREVHDPQGSVVLAVAGSAGTATASDAFLLDMLPGLLTPAGTAHLYGSHGQGREVAFSLADAPGGVLIGGAATTDFQLNGDTSSLFLVKTNAAGQTQCAPEWSPDSENVPVQALTVHPQTPSVLTPGTLDVAPRDLKTQFDVCAGSSLDR